MHDLYDIAIVSEFKTRKIALWEVKMDVSKEVDPNTHLEICFAPQSVYKAMKDFPLLDLHKFFSQKYSTSEGVPLKVLDYGCGATLAYDISAAGTNAEIVLAEYGEKCLNALQEWLSHSLGLDSLHKARCL